MTPSPGPGPAFTATAEQRAAVEHPLSPLLVVAGAGTGKTTVMAARILHLVQTGQVRQDQVLGLTFTNKAAANLKQRVGEHLGPDADVTIGTYHSFGASLVSAHALELGLDPGTQVLNRAQTWQLLFAVFDEFRFERRSTFKPSLVVDDAVQLASRCADHLVPIAEVAADCAEVERFGRWKAQREAAAARRELCQVVEAYERRKRERNLVDFGDQVRLAVDLLRRHPEVAEALRRQHPVVLLDEYQDTNYAQRVLLQLVYPEGSAVTAVGDDMQSIYAFRGAHLANILRFGRHFPPVATQPLETNRRSGAELVALANRIQAQVGEALPKDLVPLAGAPSTSIECFLAADDAEEASVIAADVAAVGPPWADSAVLCRKRRLIPAVVSALESRGVPVDVVGSSGLLDRPEVVDLVSWLEVLADPSATIGLLRVLQGPRYRIGWRDLAALARHARRLAPAGARRQLADALDDLPEVADLSPAARHRLGAFCEERRALSVLAGRLSVLDLAEAVTRQTGLWEAAGGLGRENLLRFFDLAARFAPVDGEPGLAPFVDYLHLLDESEEDLAEAHLGDHDAVHVLTVHQAKGLEFTDVWVPGLAGAPGSGWGIFPDARVAENPLGSASALPWWVWPDDRDLPHWRDAGHDDLLARLRRRHQDEEWRLLYVACTRARRRLVCSAAQWYPGPAEPKGPSAFYDFVAAQGDLVTERFRHEPAAVDPTVAARERRRAAARVRADARAATEAAGTDARPVPPGPEGPAPVPVPARSWRRPIPTSWSVTDLVAHRRCPLQFWWSAVRRLPRRPSPAARIGTEVHRWIEERAGRPLRLLDPAAEPGAPLAAPATGAPGPGAADPAASVTAGLRASYEASPYAALEPLRVEAPFVLVLDGRMVQGRVDAVYERDARVEVVDFKTGREPVPGDPAARVQLDLYALAAADAWGVDPDRLRATYCYLRTDGPPRLDSRDLDRPALDAIRGALGQTLAGLDEGRFDARAGRWCARCDFVDFCPAGQAAVVHGDGRA